MRGQADILQDLQEAAQHYPLYKRLFLADGDAFVMPAARIIEIIEEAFRLFTHLERVSAYATVRDILSKSDEELQNIRQAGLSLLYIGLESGSDEVLERMEKRQTQDEYVEACRKAKEAGFQLSVTLILGLGERELSEEHIKESARAISRSKPEYASFLSLQLSPEAPIFQDVEEGRFVLLSDDEIMRELKLFVEWVDSEGTVFRSNHASNPLAVAGTFNQDREKMLSQIVEAMKTQDYRPESWRGL